MAGRVVLVGTALEHALVDEAPEPLREDVAPDAEVRWRSSKRRTPRKPRAAPAASTSRRWRSTVRATEQGQSAKAVRFTGVPSGLVPQGAPARGATRIADPDARELGGLGHEPAPAVPHVARLVDRSRLDERARWRTSSGRGRATPGHRR